jgi:hypothetical protein
VFLLAGILWKDQRKIFFLVGCYYAYLACFWLVLFLNRKFGFSLFFKPEFLFIFHRLCEIFKIIFQWENLNFKRSQKIRATISAHFYLTSLRWKRVISTRKNTKIEETRSNRANPLLPYFEQIENSFLLKLALIVYRDLDNLLRLQTLPFHLLIITFQNLYDLVDIFLFFTSLVSCTITFGKTWLQLVLRVERWADRITLEIWDFLCIVFEIA